MKAWWKNVRRRAPGILISLAVGFCAALPKHTDALSLSGACVAAAPTLGGNAFAVFAGQAAGCLLTGNLRRDLPVSAVCCLFLLLFRRNIRKGKDFPPALLGGIRGAWGVILTVPDFHVTALLLTLCQAALESTVLFFAQHARSLRLTALSKREARLTAFITGGVMLWLADGGTAGVSLSRAVTFFLLAACVILPDPVFGVAYGTLYALSGALLETSLTPFLPVAMAALCAGISFRTAGRGKTLTSFAVGGLGVWVVCGGFFQLPLLPPELAAAIAAAWRLPRKKPRPAYIPARSLPAQYRDLAKRVDDLCRTGAARVTFFPETARAARDALRRAGYLAPGVTCAKDLLGGFFLDVSFEKNGSPLSPHALLGRMERVCGFPLAIRRYSEEGGSVSACFVRKAPFTVQCAAVCKTKTGETVCGDNAVAFSTDQDHYMLLLSDGMGSGKTAFAQSFWTVTLLQKLLRAGVGAKGAVSMVHSSLQMKNEDVSFATVDLCGIDLVTGQAEFIKAGAATTFIVRQDRVTEVSAVSMPLGATDSADVATVRETLSPGDVVVLISDGALDQKDKLLSLLPEKRDLPCETLAGDLMRCVCEESGTPDDDVTVLAARFCENS